MKCWPEGETKKNGPYLWAKRSSEIGITWSENTDVSFHIDVRCSKRYGALFARVGNGSQPTLTS